MDKRCQSKPSFVNVDVESQYLQMVRYASLSSRCNRMCYVASKTTESFNQRKMKFFQLTTQIEELCNFQNSLTDKMTTPVYDPVKKHGKRKQVSENQKPSKVKKCEYCKNE